MKTGSEDTGITAQRLLRGLLSGERVTKTDRDDRSKPPASGAEVVGNLPDYYRLLEIGRTATQQDVAAAYRYFAKKSHPATTKFAGGTEQDRSAMSFMQYNEAFEVLGNPKSRAVYDFYGTNLQTPKYLIFSTHCFRRRESSEKRVNKPKLRLSRRSLWKREH